MQRVRALLDLARPLERQLFVRPGPGPQRHRELDALEVEVVARVGQCAQRGGQLVGQVGLARQRGLVDAHLQWPGQPAGGYVAHVLDALGQQGLDDPAAAREDAEREFRRFGTAIGQERAGKGVGAVRPDAYRGLLARQGIQAARDPARNLAEQGLDLPGQIHLAQQPAVIAVAGVGEAGVDVGQVDPLDRVAGRADHPGLHRAVGEVVGLDPGRGLHLGEVPGAVDLPEHVGAHQHPAAAEGGLEQRLLRVTRQLAAGQLQRLAERHLGPDQVPSGIEPMHDLVEPVALPEATLQFGRDLAQLRAIGLQPQPLRALHGGEDP